MGVILEYSPLTAKCESKLEKRHRRPPARAKTVIHYLDVRLSPTKLGIYHD